MHSVFLLRDICCTANKCKLVLDASWIRSISTSSFVPLITRCGCRSIKPVRERQTHCMCCAYNEQTIGYASLPNLPLSTHGTSHIKVYQKCPIAVSRFLLHSFSLSRVSNYNRIKNLGRGETCISIAFCSCNKHNAWLKISRIPPSPNRTETEPNRS